MLQLQDISFSYDKEKPLLKGISFQLEKGDHLCVMGESGCGKSTLLKVIYGLYDLDEGSITWDEKPILGPAYHLIPGMDFTKFVAQDFDLMPYLTVEENISKFLSRFYPEESKKRTDELLEVIEMTQFAKEKVKYLSGGQKQRVAIARALAKEPELLLLDEPFGQIDNFKKNSLRRMLYKFLKEKNITCIVATHDSEDALAFADKMMVIQNGQNISYGVPKKLFKDPQSVYVASLFDEVNELNLGGVKRLLYPQQIKIVESSGLRAQVMNSYYQGTHWMIELKIKDQIIFSNHHEDLKKNTPVHLLIESFDQDNMEG
ncbi:ABC transporter ATP-binding protein [Lutimonas saemankumensis]|uniref:ABC transporter ATP-binding protein n=1 Tax=Lutimonas saemankumensis TaxID=483016 RepID=UPI001CD3C5B5|nr:ABC transporter ATP-binding protein [Lutimonas saemankumensis]MCA0933890.1 ABC transporter ATP-binding protein [Lutimonas saemankumensis]